MSEFDVRNVDLDTLASIAEQGGIEGLEAFASTGKVETPAPENQESEPPTEKSEAAPAPAQEQPAAKPAEPQEHTAVSTKDGKGTIPYSVLKNAREQGAELRQENEVLRRQIDELTQRASQVTATPAQQAAEEKATDQVETRIQAMMEKADQLKADFPELAEMFATQAELLKSTRDEMIALRNQQSERDQNAAAEKARQTGETVQDVIDSNPTLSFWQGLNGPEWAAAVAQDDVLKQQPEWAEKPMSERFAKAVELVQVMNPKARMPEADTSADSQTQEPTTKPGAQKVVPPVHSLSDIPGGVPPAASLTEQVDEMSAAALGNKFMNMNPEQIQDYLASLAM